MKPGEGKTYGLPLRARGLHGSQHGHNIFYKYIMPMVHSLLWPANLAKPLASLASNLENTKCFTSTLSSIVVTWLFESVTKEKVGKTQKALHEFFAA
jgi:hypothetical protein